MCAMGFIERAPEQPMYYPPPNAYAPPFAQIEQRGSYLVKEPSMMECLWHGEFSKHFTSFHQNLWYISPTSGPPSPKWKRFKDSAKVRFCCGTCGHGWTSMKGRIMFWFYLFHRSGEGFLQFKLYGQKCQRCNTENFELPMWYPEEVGKVMQNVYNRVGQVYYGFQQTPLIFDRRVGRPRTQHNSELCQACQDGECGQK